MTAAEVVTPTRAALGQHAAPLLRTASVEAASATSRWHCPGHQGGHGSASDLVRLVGRDVLAADVWVETTAYQRVRREAEDLAAAAWGAERAWLLGNGSTAGNLAWLLGSLDRDDKVVVARDVHVSVLAGLTLTGARPVWVVPEVHEELGLPLGVTPSDVDRALTAHPDARHVVITSPGYASTAPDLAAVVAVARRHGAVVYVDQAWGPHLAFHPDLPHAALDVGAHGSVVSVHKTATAMSSGAILLASGDLDAEALARLDGAVRMTQTTSPLVPLMASVDAARRDLAVAGRPGIERAVERARTLRHRLGRVRGLRVIDAESLGLPGDRVDPLKVVVDVTGTGRTGWDVDDAMRRFGAPAEGADAERVFLVVPAVSPSGPREVVTTHLDGVVAALESVASGGHAVPQPRRAHGSHAWRAALLPGEQVLTPGQARWAPVQRVTLATAAGRVAAEPLVPYPPGIPAVVPGERITARAVRALRDVVAGGGHVHGCADPSLATVAVVAD